MDLTIFVKKKYVWLSLLSLVGQIILISTASAILLYADVSLEATIILVVLLVGLIYVLSVTILRLINLAKVTGLYGKS
ncbi:MAG: hypothetical protein AWU59_2477 [Methanolobus sp. T82-4]|jgi:hypothetical protein|nr:MAG: hypothetical protein AWU59_2477 [Methanolobus sp. T82-4]